MTSIQDRILAQLEARITGAGLEPTIRYNFANCGMVYLHRKGEMTPFASVRFNFQDGTYTLSIKWNGAPVPSQPGRNDYFDFYQPYDQPSRFWGAFDALLGTEKPAKRSAGR